MRGSTCKLLVRVGEDARGTSVARAPQEILAHISPEGASGTYVARTDGRDSSTVPSTDLIQRMGEGAGGTLAAQALQEVLADDAGLVLAAKALLSRASKTEIR